MKSVLRLHWMVLLVAILAVSACGKQVSRRESSETIDLSGRWNDVDSQQVAQAMTQDAMSFGWIDEWRRTKGKKPVVM
ncbi:MAG: penicillin-binding protein activator LpoB, partial [Gammaproteobacteria bacterium]|nr:penicillin-binding protein activator LpoB [Gammaproteobacteria bacterium]NIR99379.1 penicillin-binding protein activator LpoB [Gammaproteobacteria bacterium]NIT64992.1 penicillin-binding protein activator LpoB [Gammaproteobacteria bacterium]NIV22015.1 penicillin-binding protein activator LpoB [Gammaproteobacteria bacterium]NIY33571.1 penicillin-binding protein activator LpoB [Gammaproteobacteria bacterium]